MTKKAPESAQRHQKSFKEPLREAQRPPKSTPRTPKGSPGAPQGSSKAAQERLKDPQKPSQDPLQRPQKTLPRPLLETEAILDPFIDAPKRWDLVFYDVPAYPIQIRRCAFLTNFGAN